MRVKVPCVRILSEKGIVFFGPREKRAADFHKLTGNPPAAFRDQSPAVDVREQTSAAANREQSPAAADCDRSSAAEYRPTTPAESEDAMTADRMPSSLQSEELRNSGVHSDTRGPQCSTHGILAPVLLGIEEQLKEQTSAAVVKQEAQE